MYKIGLTYKRQEIYKEDYKNDLQESIKAVKSNIKDEISNI